MSWQRFFEQYGTEELLADFYEDAGPMRIGTVEELYQAFSQRLLTEIGQARTVIKVIQPEDRDGA
jgi:hypothetical protein